MGLSSWSILLRVLDSDLGPNIGSLSAAIPPIWNPSGRAKHTTPRESIFGKEPNSLLYVSFADTIDDGVVLHSGVSQDKNHRVTAQEHFADVSFFVDGLSLRFALARLGHLSPNLLNILEHHITMAVKCFYSREKFVVVPHINKHL